MPTMQITSKIYSSILESSNCGKKKLALLIDPDKFTSSEVIANAIDSGVDLLFVGGSLISQGSLQHCVSVIKKNCKIPVVLFPGAADQVDAKADAILFLSLISGRNPDNLIGKHVIAAPLIKKTTLEVIPTGYMLIDGGNLTTAAYMSSTIPIPANKNDIAICTAMAGEMLGLKMIYLDTGSGALQHVPAEMVSEVKKNISIPLIAGGGIRNPEEAYQLCRAGADVIVIGTIAEKNPLMIKEISRAVNQSNTYIANV